MQAPFLVSLLPVTKIHVTYCCRHTIWSLVPLESMNYTLHDWAPRSKQIRVGSLEPAALGSGVGEGRQVCCLGFPPRAPRWLCPGLVGSHGRRKGIDSSYPPIYLSRVLQRHCSGPWTLPCWKTFSVAGLGFLDVRPQNSCDPVRDASGRTVLLLAGLTMLGPASTCASPRIAETFGSEALQRSA